MTFDLHENESVVGANSVSYERFRTNTRFDAEVKGTFEMAYYNV